jgi:Family of unknown function (DUF6390)
MTAAPNHRLSAGQALFAHYAFPPNELGYCGPADMRRDELGSHASEFDGAWPYLQAIASAVGTADPLDAEVVQSYWVGGPLLDHVEPAELLRKLRNDFRGQVTGLLDDLNPEPGVLAHHCFHVFVVYPWVGFLDRDPSTPMQVMQDCRIRWGTVDSIDGEHAVMLSRPLTYDGSVLSLGEPAAERVRWMKDLGTPAPGQVVSAHWDWICGILREDESAALAAATQATLELVNRIRNRS